jgi:RpiR family carbohydrate utilization transcriptional regulator
MAASVLTPDDVVVAISQSGRTLDLLDAVHLAQQAGAAVVAITASGSPLARLARVTLAADTPEDTETYSPMISRIVHLVLIDILAVGVALRHGPGLIEQLEKSKRSLRGKRLAGPPLQGDPPWAG